MREALKGLHKALKKSLSKALGGISLFRDHRSRNFRRNRRVKGVSGSSSALLALGLGRLGNQTVPCKRLIGSVEP